MIVSSDKVMVHDDSIFIHKSWMSVWLGNAIIKMNQTLLPFWLQTRTWMIVSLHINYIMHVIKGVEAIQFVV